MNKEKTLTVTGKYGPLEFSETACPYNENAHSEQVEACVKSIYRQISDSGKEEMINAFHISEQIE